MFTTKDYYDLTKNSRRAIAKLDGFCCPSDCKHCPFYTEDIITVPYAVGDVWSGAYEGNCIINAARVEFPNWRYE